MIMSGFGAVGFMSGVDITGFRIVGINADRTGIMSPGIGSVKFPIEGLKIIAARTVGSRAAIF
jgi:hypothetical protein